MDFLETYFIFIAIVQLTENVYALVLLLYFVTVCNQYKLYKLH